MQYEKVRSQREQSEEMHAWQLRRVMGVRGDKRIIMCLFRFSHQGLERQGGDDLSWRCGCSKDTTRET